MTKIDDAQAVNFMIADMSYIYSEYVYENNGSATVETDDMGYWVFLWIVYFVCFLLPPVPLIIVGFILPFIKKLGKPKYWFIFMAFALLWLIAALILAVLMIIMMIMLI